MRPFRLVLPALLAGALGSAASAPVAAPAAPAARAGSRASAWRPVLPFIEDDYARALHEARARGIPIFIEAWAPW